MLNTDLRVELSRSLGQSGAIDIGALTDAFSAMEQEGRARLAWFEGNVVLHRSADMRYGEQVFEIAVPLDDIEWSASDLPVRLAERFHAAHEALYTYALRDQEVVLVNARLSAVGRLRPLPSALRGNMEARAVPKAQRRVFLGGWRSVPVFAFGELAGDQVVPGPAVVESDTTTVLLRPGDQARFDRRGWLDIAVAPAH
jgi:N-methylhydantoinase A